MKRTSLLALAALAVFPLHAPASPFNWIGLTDGKWNTPTNWDSGTPASAVDTALIFDNANQLAIVNDIPGGLTLNSLNFTANSGTRTLTGNKLTFDGINPTLTMVNTIGAAADNRTTISTAIQLNQTLAITGGDITHQLIFATGAITGTGGITWAGGFGVLGAASNYTGPTVISAGGVGPFNNSAFGSTSSVTVASGATVQLDVGRTINRPLTLSSIANVAIGVPGLHGIGAGSSSYSGAITLGGNAGIGVIGAHTLTLGTIALGGNTLTISTNTSAGTVTFGNVVSGTGAIQVATTGGTALMTSAAANTFTGPISISGGKLVVNNNNKLGNLANVVTLNGGTLEGRSASFFGTVLLPASRSIVSDAPGGTLLSGTGFTQFQIDGVVSGAGPLHIGGTGGTVILTNANTFTGPLIVDNNGQVQINADSGLGALSSVIQINGTGGATQLILNGSITVDAARSVQLNATDGGVISLGNSFLAASVSGPGLLIVGGFSGGTLTLNGTNTHNGGTQISGGIVIIDSDARLGAPAAPLRLEPLATLRASASFDITRPVILDGSPATAIDTNGFTVGIPGPITGTGLALNKAGAGTLILNGNSPSLGLLHVLAGTLGGAGTVGPLTIDGGATLAPGASPGTLTTGALSLSNTSALAYELDTPGTVGSGVNDLVTVNGALALDGILNVTALGGFGIGTFRLFDYSGALTDNTLSIGTVPGGFNYAIDTATAGQVNLVVSSVGGPPTWNVDADGAWLTGSNWTGGTSPNAADAQAVLGSIIAAPRTITIGAPGATVGSLTINNASAYTVAGPGTLTLSKTGGASVTVTTGNHTISAPITLASDTTLTLGSNTLTASTIRGANALSIASGTLKLADGAGTSKVTALTLAGGTVPTSTLDLGDNKLIIDYTGASVLPTVRAQVITGRNGYDANIITNWNGKGIVSSKARTESVIAGFDLFTIGLINNADLADGSIGRDTYTTFGGLATDDSSVLLRYTYSGDADLNGQVDGDDYALIDNAFNLLIPNFGWLAGDFNYDGNIDGDDYALIDSGFLFQGAPIPSAATVAVPEPGITALLLATPALLTRRRRISIP